MVVRDPEKNRQYVAKHRAMLKANEETKKENNKLNVNYSAKCTANKKINWELMNIIKKKPNI